jgi:hypothetical protein
VDVDNSIILTGALADGIYIVKYEDAEGNLVDIGTLDHSGEPEPSYTNALLSAIDADGKPYNGGKGWKDGYRLNSSAAETADAAADVTGFIPVKWGDTLYLSGVNMGQNSKNYIYMYSGGFANLGAYFRGDSDLANATASGGIVMGENGSVKSIQLSNKTFATVPGNIANAMYVRISCDQITDESVITVNEPIA